MSDTAETAERTETTIKRFLCRHIHTSGRRCGSPALRGGQFCYYHHTTRRPGARYRGVHPSAYEFEMPDIDDRAGIQFALAQILSLIAINQLDPKRAGRLLYGLLIATSNLPREPRPTPTRRSSSHSESSSTQSSGSSCNSNLSGEVIEDLILDPDHGPIAPIAELTAPIDLEEARNKRFAQMLNDLTYPRETAPEDSSATASQTE